MDLPTSINNENSTADASVDNPISVIVEQYNGLKVHSRASVFMQLYLLSLREIRNMVRNPLLVLLHVLAAAIFGLLVGFMFYQ